MKEQAPRRVRLSRKKGWKLPPNTVSVARPGRWGNPFTVTDKYDPGTTVGARYIAVPSVVEAVELEWKPIETAPKDGTLISVMHEDVGSFTMRWGHIQQNGIFAPGQVGMWVAPDGGFTWQDADGEGPSHWSPLQ